MTEKQINNQMVKALHAVAELIPDTSNTERAQSFEDIKALLKAEQTQADFGTLNNN